MALLGSLLSRRHIVNTAANDAIVAHNVAKPSRPTSAMSASGYWLASALAVQPNNAKYHCAVAIDTLHVSPSQCRFPSMYYIIHLYVCHVRSLRPHTCCVGWDSSTAVSLGTASPPLPHQMLKLVVWLKASSHHCNSWLGITPSALVTACLTPLSFSARWTKMSSLSPLPSTIFNKQHGWIRNTVEQCSSMKCMPCTTMFSFWMTAGTCLISTGSAPSSFSKADLMKPLHSSAE